MGQVHRFLGLTVGVIVHDLDDRQRQEAYGADITYGTNNEYGFDYLRDNMKRALEYCVQRELHYAIVDEVDSILIDEARTPLIISGPSEENTQVYAVADRVVRQLKAGAKGDANKGIEETGDFWFDEKDHVAALTEEGVRRVEQLLRIQNLYDPEMLPVNHAVQQALSRTCAQEGDVDYVVKPGRGRQAGGRDRRRVHRPADAGPALVRRPAPGGGGQGGDPVRSENQTLASITFQNYFRMYEKLSGMTGTADTEAPEFAKIYDLDVLVIPSNRPMIREDLPDLIYKTGARSSTRSSRTSRSGTPRASRSWWARSRSRRRRCSRPSSSAPASATTCSTPSSTSARPRSWPRRARKGAVTISTNMAGRGTDIVLGGNPEYLALAKCGHDRMHPDFPQWQAHFETLCAGEREEVVAAGGLHIIGTERHESRRIDNQLRGRSGRQGDPGSSRFYLSLEDDLLRLFGSDRIQGWMERLGLEEGEAIEHRWVTRAIENAQKKVEARNFDVRKHLLDYDDVMNKQRKAFYGRRRATLASAEVHDEVLDMVEGVLVGMLDAHWPDKGEPEPEQLAALARLLEAQFGVAFDPAAAPFAVGPDAVLDKETLGRAVHERLLAVLAEKERRWDALRERYPQVGLITHRQLERDVMLRTLDRLWKDHLYAMDALRDGIRFRGYAQRDPKVEYAREGFALFEEMNQRIDTQVTEEVFKVWIDEARLEQASRAAPAAAAVRGAERRGRARRAGRPGGSRPACDRRARFPAGRLRPARRSRDADGRQAGRRRQGRPQRPLPVRERQEVQALLRSVSAPVAGARPLSRAAGRAIPRRP
jgi:preprotein translocase subunit SecA